MTSAGAQGADASAAARPLDIFVIAGEASGDQLGAALMDALRRHAGGQTIIRGVGGPAMQTRGLKPLFPMADIAVMGFAPVIANLPRLLSRISETARAVIAHPPDALVLIDSPDFTHRVARKVRKALPHLPIFDYVSPTVWAWRPGRAKAMRAYVDQVLAILPFEPAAHARLGGPDCVYVGHPLIERFADLRPDAQENARRAAQPPLLLALPGSRRSEVARLMADFGAAFARVAQQIGPIDIVLPAVAHLADDIRARAEEWPVKPRIVLGDEEKFAAFRQARAALAASGTVTLELALAQIPTVVAYKVSAMEAAIARRMIGVPSIVLPNLILDAAAFPEFLQQDCTPQRLADALIGVTKDGDARDAQLRACDEVAARMSLTDGEAPSDRAARAVLERLKPRR